jgi:succinyl-diaminopimelate desuccinylase
MPDAAFPPHDPIPLAQALLRCASVTPADLGALDTLQSALEKLGFACRRMKFGDVDNLFAKRGAGLPHFCFAGHTDVVPPGDVGAWSVDPFAAEIRDGNLVARGAVDMKAAIACFVSAVASIPVPAKGAISLLITGDEEALSIDGTRKVLAALLAEGEQFSHCLIGEPTSVDRVADTIKNGRRGSFNCVIIAEGKQGHVAYPHRSLNPMGPLLDLLDVLRRTKLDDGAPGFDPSHLEITSIDVGDGAHNVIPARAKAKLNIRFNSNHTGETIKAWIEQEAARIAAQSGARFSIDGRATGEAFYCDPGPFTVLVQDAAETITGQRPVLSTTGGTSDARFMHKACPTCELGLLNETAHKVDEFAPLEDIRTLARIYTKVLANYFAAFAA